MTLIRSYNSEENFKSKKSRKSRKSRKKIIKSNSYAYLDEQYLEDFYSFIDVEMDKMCRKCERLKIKLSILEKKISKMKNRKYIVPKNVTIYTYDKYTTYFKDEDLNDLDREEAMCLYEIDQIRIKSEIRYLTLIEENLKQKLLDMKHTNFKDRFSKIIDFESLTEASNFKLEKHIELKKILILKI